MVHVRVSDSVASDPAVSGRGEYMVGAAVAVLRDALDLMETQGAAVGRTDSE